jgi:hypothetical protein
MANKPQEKSPARWAVRARSERPPAQLNPEALGALETWIAAKRAGVPTTEEAPARPSPFGRKPSE